MESHEVDYRDLLIRYVLHVAECEGTDFLKPQYRTPYLSNADMMLLSILIAGYLKERTEELDRG